MATIYVRTNGNDTSGNGSTGTPYATIIKALSVAAGGDIIIMGTGTYPTDSGSGFFQLGSNFASFVQIWPESGNLGDVVITSTGPTYVMQIVAASFVQFNGIVFRSQASTVTQVVRFLNQTIANIRFVRCRFEVLGQSGTTNLAIGSNWTSGTFTVSNAALVDCEVRELGPFHTGGILLDNATGTPGAVVDFQIVNTKVGVGSFGARLMGLSRFAVHNSEFASTSPVVAGTALQIGVDGATGADTTGTVSKCRATALTGHAAVIGAGCSAVDVLDSDFFGGANATNGQGYVVKAATGGRHKGLTVYGGFNSTLYLKACKNILFEDSAFIARYANGPALRAGVNSEDGGKIARDIIRQCVFSAPVGLLIAWDAAAGDAGGCEVDQNAYVVSGSATWGTVRGNTINSLASLRAAWTGYDRAYNDSNSRSGLGAMRSRGRRQIALA